MKNHDPSEYIRGLQSLLVNDKKRIGFLFGAGTSLAKKNELSVTVPAIGRMTNDIISEITNDKFSNALIEIKEEIGITAFNIESLLSNLEQKKAVICAGELNGLNLEQFEELIEVIKAKIYEKVSIHNELDPKNQVQTDLADWIRRADRKYPIEIFTTNYDYLFELGLEYCDIPYFDGFAGSYEPFFCSELVSDTDYLPKQTKLWKIHGSLGWKHGSDYKKVIRKSADTTDILIYPSILKYANSKKQPYEALMDRLSSFLKQDDSVLITCGYSFGDEHINERILTALKTSSTSTVIALFYDEYTTDLQKLYSLNTDSNITKLAKSNSKLSVYGCRSAVIGCKYGEWCLKREFSYDEAISMNLYFDEDVPMDNISVGQEGKGSELWTGTGKLTIPNFANLITFLLSLSNSQDKVGD